MSKKIFLLSIPWAGFGALSALTGYLLGGGDIDFRPMSAMIIIAALASALVGTAIYIHLHRPG